VAKTNHNKGKGEGISPRYNRDEIPIAGVPMFTSIKITQAERKKRLIVPTIGGMNPPNYLAEISTYNIEFSLDSALGAKEKEALRSSFERRIQDIYNAESFAPYISRTEAVALNLSWRDYKKLIPIVMVENPPSIKVSGLTLDMLFQLTKLGILETNLHIAHEFQNAAKLEYRGPLMSSDIDYDCAPNQEEFDRTKVRHDSEDAIGDFGAVAPENQYSEAIHHLKQGLARGHIKGQKHFESAVGLVAIATLKGLLPSPYPTEHQLLGNGTYTDNPESKAEMLKARVQEILPAIMGENKKLKLTDNDKGNSFGAHVTRLERQEKHRVKREHIPKWYIGTSKEWELATQQSLAQAYQWAKEMQDKGSEQFDMPEILKKIDSLTSKEFDEYLRKDDLLKKREAVTDNALAKAEDVKPLTWGELSFFGVKHTLPIGFYGSGETVDYTSRNPLVDRPRSLPYALQALLDKEIRERVKIGMAGGT
jgi:hypothetical protein